METLNPTAVNLKRSHDVNRDHFNYKGGGAGGGGMVPERKRERERNERENNHEREAEKRDMKEKIRDNRRSNKIEKEDKNLTLAFKGFRAFYEMTVAIKQIEW